jgi:hypothetical protein
MLLQYRDLRNREYISMDDAGGQGQGQSRIDIEGRGGTKFLGKILQHTTFHTVFVGGLVGAGQRNSTLGSWHPGIHYCTNICKGIGCSMV